jgi:hypothetical protein
VSEVQTEIGMGGGGRRDGVREREGGLGGGGVKDGEMGGILSDLADVIVGERQRQKCRYEDTYVAV